MIGWSREQLAEASKVALRTIVDFERAARQPRHATLDVLTRALETAGVIFVAENGEGAGVRLRKDVKPAADPLPAAIPSAEHRATKRAPPRGKAEKTVDRLPASVEMYTV